MIEGARGREHDMPAAVGQSSGGPASVALTSPKRPLAVVSGYSGSNLDEPSTSSGADQVMEVDENIDWRKAARDSVCILKN